VTKIFRSVRFNITLGAVITLAAAAGTLIPQIGEAPEKAAQFQTAHPQWTKLFEFFNLFDLYRSWWFMGLLGLMAFDIVLCKLWSLPPDQGLVALPPEATREKEAEKHLAQKATALKLKPHQGGFASALPYERAVAAAQTTLGSGGFKFAADFATPAGSAFVATKHGIQRWGSYLAHIALVVILLGSLVKGLYGFVEMVPVLEGRSRAMQNHPDWEIFVDKFTIKYYDGTREPKHFSSELRVKKGDKEIGRKTILVNDPLDIGGVRFYQASWGAGGMFRSVTLKVGQTFIKLPQRKAMNIAGTPFKVMADLMLPNFGVGANGPEAASLDMKNPAVRLVFQMGPHSTRPLWLFENDPELCLIEGEDGQVTRAPKPPFELAAIDPVLFSGIQVAYDPGYTLVMVGSLLWLFGTISLFYLHRRRLWVLVEPDGPGSRVSVGGWSSRGAHEFEKEFGVLMERLRSSMEPRSDVELSRSY
jgi:cytochrome c biogenesis protein